MRASGLVLVVLLAGCLQPDAGETPPADEPAAPAAGAAPSRAPAAAPAANRTDLGHMPHMHDYWAGRDRVTLFDGTVEPPTPDQQAFWTGVEVFVNKEARAGGYIWSFPDGQIVYEGTGLLEITAEWSDPSITSLGARIRAGDGGDFGPLLTLPRGETVVLEITPEMTDMPHMSRSRWVFWFTAGEAPGAALGPFQLRADIVRMRDVMAFPGHPDLFGDADSLVLHDAPGESRQVSYARRTPNLVLNGEFGEHFVTPQRIVPMETLAILAEVDVKSASASVGEVSEIRFFFQTADASWVQRVQPIEGGMAERRYVFAIPVTMENTDSPYAETSQWRFLVEAATTLTGSEMEKTCGGCVDTEVQFHLTLTAFDHELERMSEISGN